MGSHTPSLSHSRPPKRRQYLSVGYQWVYLESPEGVSGIKLLDWKGNLGMTDRYIRVILGTVPGAFALSGVIGGGLAVAALVFAASQYVEAAYGY